MSGNTSADTTWNNAHAGMKQITLTADETTGGMQFACTYGETAGVYGTVQVNDSLVASHTPATADANDVFTIENGALKVTTSTTNGTDYTLVNGALSVNNGFTGTITSTATFSNEVQTKEIDFIYDHNGMRTGKIVSENGRVEITEYTLHGKLITHMTKRTVDENGDETTQELHFFYDAQSKPAFVEFEGEKYRYIHNLQGDIVAIVDASGNLMVEYKYDVWGKLVSVIGNYIDSLGKYNLFHYRGYVYDYEFNMYYLRSRYFNPMLGRFANSDSYIGKVTILGQHNQFSYCANVPVGLRDENGKSFLTELKSLGEKLVYNLLYKPQLKFWNAVCVGLYALGYKHSAELLIHSLQPKPANLYYSNDSAIAKKIKGDVDFTNKMNVIIEDGLFNVDESMSFNSDFDLFGAIHNVGMIVSPVTINGVDMYHVIMTDIYDFKYEEDYSSQSASLLKRAMKAGAIAGNNLAYVDMNLGAINEYKITIDFYVE